MNLLKKRIVIINGMGGSGKDTFVEFCAKHTKIMNISSVDKVKEAAKILVGWNGIKDEKSRKLLVDLKRISIEYNDYPTKYILEENKKFLTNDADILFIHIREISEIQKRYQNILESSYLDEVLDKGILKTREIAKNKYYLMKERIGLGR